MAESFTGEQYETYNQIERARSAGERPSPVPGETAEEQRVRLNRLSTDW